MTADEHTQALNDRVALHLGRLIIENHSLRVLQEQRVAPAPSSVQPPADPPSHMRE